MLNALGTSLLLTGLLAGSAAGAATVGQFSSASASVSLNWSTSSEDPDAIRASGEAQASTGASVSGENGTASNLDEATLLLENVSDEVVDLFLDASIVASAGTTIDEGGTPRLVRFDSNALATLSGPSLGSTGFASTNGGYLCSVVDLSAPDYDCFGASQSSNEFDTPLGFLSLNPGESALFTLTATAFATIETTPLAAVPLPAGGLLLGAALGAFGLLGRRRG